MRLAAVLLGAACGLSLAACALAQWGCRRPNLWSGLGTGLLITGWLTAALLSAGAWCAWQAGASLGQPALRLMLIAAVAAPASAGLTRCNGRAGGLPLLPAAMACASLIMLVAGRNDPVTDIAAAPLVVVAASAAAGLAVWAGGEALVRLLQPTAAEGWALGATLGALTVTATGALGYSLLTRGRLWPAAGLERGLVGAWLMWVSLWLWPRAPQRLSAGLAVAATIGVVAAVVALV